MKIIWFVSSLEQVGGGERFALESVNAIRALGLDALLVCDRIDEAASFNGRYDLSRVVCTRRSFDSSASYGSRVTSKLSGMVALAKVLQSEHPDMVICQSEFDAIRLYVISRFIRFPYRVFVFGQMYQFKTDLTRYSRVFRKHLSTIIDSRPGYRETVSMPPPRLRPTTWIANEVISRFKRVAIRRSDRVFAVSTQVQWEVGLVYGVPATVCRAAFDDSFIDVGAVSTPKPVGTPPRLISLSRLVDKKRIDLIIEGFSRSRPGSRLRIIGTGPEERHLKALANASPRSSDIEFVGAASDAELMEEFLRADCLVSMDIGDYDISVVEALGKGLRVIVATDFDMTGFDAPFQGIRSIPPTTEDLAEAIDEIESMPGPTSANLGPLRRLTWRHLAMTATDLGHPPSDGATVGLT